MTRMEEWKYDSQKKYLMWIFLKIFVKYFKIEGIFSSEDLQMWRGQDISFYAIRLQLKDRQTNTDAL